MQLSSIKFPSGFKKISRNFALLAVDKLIRFALGFFVGLWTTRFLGPENYGYYSYIYTIFGLFASFSSLGLDTILVREFVKNPEKEDELFGTGFFLGTIGAVLATILAVTLGFILTNGDLEKVGILAIVTVGYFISSFFVIDWWYQAQVKGHFSVISSGTAYTLVSLFKIFLILSNAPLFWFIMCFLFEICISASLFVFLYHAVSKRKITNWKVNMSLAKDLVMESWPVVLAGISTSIYMRADQLILGTLDKSILGIYAAATRITELYYFFPTVVLISIFPTIVKSQDDTKKFNKRIRALLSFMLYQGIIIALVTAVLAPFITTLLYGEKYLGSEEILRIYAWTYVPVSLNLIVYYYLVARKTTYVTFVKAVLSGISSLALSLVFVYFWGAKGAAFAYITAGVLSILFIGFFKRAREFLVLLIESLNPFVLINYLFDDEK
jgi:PST family polysaccharide transporter